MSGGHPTTDELIYDLIRACWGCPGCSGTGHLFYPSGCMVCRACQPYRALVLEHQRATMDMDAKPGRKVIFANGFNGWDHDVKQAREKLTLGGIYTVKRVEMGDSQTTVWLEEFPGVRWNHVLFANAEAA